MAGLRQEQSLARREGMTDLGPISACPVPGHPARKTDICARAVESARSGHTDWAPTSARKLSISDVRQAICTRFEGIDSLPVCG